MNQDLMVVQQSAAKSHIFLDIPTVSIYVYGIEVTIKKLTSQEDWTILGIYRSPKVPVLQLCQAITEVINSISPENIIILNSLIDAENRPLYNLLVNDKH